jgi:parallel beta-helix repeat protein
MVGNGFSDCDFGLTSYWESDPLVNVVVIENKFNEVNRPISVSTMETSTIANNYITRYSGAGIQISSGANNVSILNNQISDRIGNGASTSGAIYINLGRGCNISGNVLNHCDSIGLTDVDDSFVANNTLVLYSIRGIYAMNSDNNTIVRNLISNNEMEAIRFRGTGNVIHHNTFITENRTSRYNQSLAVSSYDSAFNKDNRWDDGSEGNYWSNYVGRYPDASADGRVWDSPYYIDDTGDIHVLDEHPLTLMPDFIPPTAEAGDDLLVDEGTLVTLNGNLSFDNSGILSYSWTIESPDGEEKDVGETIEFLFLVPGMYEVTLQVTDPWGNSAFDSIVVDVMDVLPPVASIVGELEVGVSEEVILDGTGSMDAGGITNYTWKVVTDDDILVFFGPIFKMTFFEVGNHTVELTVFDTVGHSDSTTVEITVRDDQPPVAMITGTLEVAQDEWVYLFGNSSTDNVGIVDMTWHIALVKQPLDHVGDSFSFRTLEIGMFQVTLTVSDGEGNEDIAQAFLRIFDATPPVAHAGSDRNVDIDTTIQFDGTDSSDNMAIVSYSWEFTFGGRNVTFDGSAAEFTFTQAGRYGVTLTVVDAAGLSDTDEMIVTVEQDQGTSQLTTELLFVFLASGLVLFVIFILYISKKHQDEKGST